MRSLRVEIWNRLVKRDLHKQTNKKTRSYRQNQLCLDWHNKNVERALYIFKETSKEASVHMDLCVLFLENTTHEIMHLILRGGGLGSRPKKMYGERLGDGVEYHLMKPTPRR